MKRFALALILAASASGASATPIDLYFRGPAQNTPTDRITLRNADGAQYVYQGSNAPTYPVRSGDPVKVMFELDSNFDPANPGTAGENGLYRIPIRGMADADPGVSATLRAVNFGRSGHVEGADAQGLSLSGMGLVYDPASGSYSLEFDPAGYSFGGVAMPGYSYDPVADLFTPGGCGGDGKACATGSGHGTADSLFLPAVPVYSADGEKIGEMEPLAVRGGFEAPYVNGAQVPAPPAAALFAAALILLAVGVGRRRRPAKLTPRYA